MLPMQVRRVNRPTWEDPFQAEFNRMLTRFLGDGGTETTALTGYYPVDIREDGDHFYIEAELPGFTKDQVNITLENGVLSIVAERRQEEQQKGETHLNERRFTRVARSFTLPNAVNESNVEASLQDGVLRIQLNKREEVKPRKIAVK